ALAALGERDRAKEWIEQALLIDPDNLNMRYNLACAVSVYLKDSELALAILEPFFAATSENFVRHAEVDPDLAAVRLDARFATMVEVARKRLAGLPG
ncbi:MAG TPA: hypothetical protein VFW13_13245, partial [Phenylobacterium sp.]|nr:hypothetical protein [Phenylobacterium sp.]